MRALNGEKTRCRYFSDVLIEVKLVLTVLPMLLTAVTITMLRPAAIRQYSMAVAPDSSRRNLEISCRIQNSLGAPISPTPTPCRNLDINGCEYIDEHAERWVNRTGGNSCIVPRFCMADHFLERAPRQRRSKSQENHPGLLIAGIDLQSADFPDLPASRPPEELA
jgi:hypothetical protein